MIEAERIFAARQELAEALARNVADELVHAIEAKGKATLAVSGGTTPGLFLEKLSNIDLPWHRVTITVVDERKVPETSERSNARLVREVLLRNKAAAAHFMPLRGDSGSDTAVPFDVTVLGMGNDGHTASFFPGGDRLCEALDAESGKRIVEIVAPGAGEPRLTFTFPVIESSGRLYLHIEGAEKKKILKEALDDGPVEDMPIRAVLRSATPVTLYWCP
ncbi:MAG: 6-phosphogluconolactonase [Alphaproteobacteria bacterium]|nr:6-phosphogluconolactonase [Alphaproteobacteria bacterium]